MLAGFVFGPGLIFKGVTVVRGEKKEKNLRTKEGERYHNIQKYLEIIPKSYIVEDKHPGHIGPSVFFWFCIG